MIATLRRWQLNRIKKVMVLFEDGSLHQWYGAGTVGTHATQIPVKGLSQPQWPYVTFVQAQLVIEPIEEVPSADSKASGGS